MAASSSLTYPGHRNCLLCLCWQVSDPLIYWAKRREGPFAPPFLFYIWQVRSQGHSILLQVEIESTLCGSAKKLPLHCYVSAAMMCEVEIGFSPYCCLCYCGADRIALDQDSVVQRVAQAQSHKMGLDPMLFTVVFCKESWPVLNVLRSYYQEVIGPNPPKPHMLV